MKIILLDRDGVINHDSDDYIKTAREWEAIPGSLEAIARLCQNGYRVIIVSNQPGLARKKFDIIALNEIHRKMIDHLAQYGGAVDAIFFCPHGSKQDCECRKPKPGLLNTISKRLRISLVDVPFVGDKLSDIDAARAVGASPILVRTGKGQALVDANQVPNSVFVYDDLAAVADDLIPAK
ncbi:MAG: D-glycero-beta-D-manno-heptose 1,7-bisphosphate 7-phosphatase [Gammaproteobacteria bacterium]|nr:D-glycero-beta-D-manno-heptose 1,7-bisphosphate 7-phosphatase [Gammaproteobacteria bacterium]